jgi:hypothetical protein
VIGGFVGSAIGEKYIDADTDQSPLISGTVLQPGPSGPTFTRDRWRHLKELEAQVAEAEARAIAAKKHKERLAAIVDAAVARNKIIAERVRQRAEWAEQSRLLALQHALDRTNAARSTAQALEAARLVQWQALAHADDDDEEALTLLLMH